MAQHHGHDVRFPWVPVAVILAMLGASVAVSLGSRDVWAPDEPRYALVAKEMLGSGHWLIPHLNGEPYPDKPPLMFWSIALAAAVTGGVGQSAAVLPSLLSMLAALAGTARLAWIVSGRRDPLVPVLATAIAGVSYRFVMQGGFGQIDMLLCAFTTWAFALLTEGVAWGRDRPSRPAFAIAAYALMGLAVLAKGPVGLICPLGGFVVGALLAGRRGAVRQALLRPAGWGAFATVVGAWLAPAAALAMATGRSSWLGELLFDQTLVRYAASWHHHEPWWYLLVVPLYDFQPAIWLLPGAIASLIAARGDRARAAAPWLLAGACAFILVFFSIPSGKRQTYLLPVYPLASVWLALDLWPRIRGLAPARWPRFAAGLVSVGGVVLAAASAFWFPAELAEEGLTMAVWPLTAVFALIAAGAGAAAWRPGNLWAWSCAWVPWVMLWGVAYGLVFPAADALKSPRELTEAVRRETVAGASGGMVEFRARFGLRLGELDAAPYDHGPGLDRLARRLEGDEPFWVIVEEVHLDKLQRRLSPEAEVVTIHRDRSGDKRYRVLANRAALASPKLGSEEVESEEMSPEEMGSEEQR